MGHGSVLVIHCSATVAHGLVTSWDPLIHKSLESQLSSVAYADYTAALVPASTTAPVALMIFTALVATNLAAVAPGMVSAATGT